MLPALFAVSYRMRQRVFPATWDGQQREGDVAQIVDEDVTGVRVVKAFGQESRELDRLVGAAQRLYGSRLRATRLNARYQPILEAIPSLAQVAILVVGGLLALRGEITLGTFLAFSTYVGAVRRPGARNSPPSSPSGQQARAGAERIFQLLDLQPRIADAPDAIELADVRGEIVFEDVRFGLRRRRGRPRRAEPAHRRRRTRRHRRGRAAAASRRSPRSCRASTIRTPAGCLSTGTTCAR